MILIPAAGFTVATAILLWPGSLMPIALSMAVGGLLNGPMDIAMFTMRQRCTDPAWMGRAFTVSMNLNFSGFPIGAALAGIMVSVWPVEDAGVADPGAGGELGPVSRDSKRPGGYARPPNSQLGVTGPAATTRAAPPLAPPRNRACGG